MVRYFRPDDGIAPVMYLMIIKLLIYISFEIYRQLKSMFKATSPKTTVSELFFIMHVLLKNKKTVSYEYFSKCNTTF